MPDNVRHLSGAVTLNSETDPNTIVLLRERLDMARSTLGDRIGRAPAFMRALERKTRILTPRDTAALCQVLGVPPEALSITHTHATELGGSFNAQGVGVRRRRQCVAYANLAGDAASTLLTMPEVTVATPPLSIPNLDETDAIETAIHARRSLKLGNTQIEHLGEFLERLGCVILPQPVDDPDLTAFTLLDATRGNGAPFIFLDTTADAIDQRFALARELGRIMNPSLTDARRLKDHTRDMRLDSFALEFLAPAAGLDGVLDAAQPSQDLSRVVALQDVWGVSATRLIARARDLGVLTERSRASWAHACREHERVHAASTLAERPRVQFHLISTVLQALGEAGWTPFMLAARLALHESELRRLLPGWWPSQYEGSREAAPALRALH
ncbi:ImmA/IrrE family metallo-endopeptidase [Dermacoccus abyssi]|uniref:ImmA/IrrE family metallo-endopeptidase n=1 Tax=Dermacoccus abyssi TaxID=322596 RepID=UPI002AD21AE6|nr:XRE family transcriptional regulator [Dermacoccus abyssi]